jgi:hypothetical protein
LKLRNHSKDNNRGGTQAASDNGNPFDVPLASEIAEQQAQAEENKRNLVDKWTQNPSSVPNARLRNLPNPAEE